MDKCTGSASKTDVVTGLGYWTDYKLKVSAETSAGKGPYTNYITVKTDEHGKHHHNYRLFCQ